MSAHVGKHHGVLVSDIEGTICLQPRAHNVIKSILATRRYNYQVIPAVLLVTPYLLSLRDGFRARD